MNDVVVVKDEIVFIYLVIVYDGVYVFDLELWW